MNIANLVVVLVLMHYTVHIIKMLFSKKNRIAVQEVNTRLEELRCKPIKSIEEQKEFVNLKKPKMIGKFKWSWRLIPDMIISAIPYVVIFRLYLFIFNYYKFDFPLWVAVFMIILFPLLINMTLVKFGVQKGDIAIFFRGGKKQ